MGALLAHEFPDLADHATTLRTGGLVTKMRLGGGVLFSALGEQAWRVSLEAASDTVRGWGAMAVGSAPELPLERRVSLLRPFASDPHFAVREWAWLALRPHVAANPIGALVVLQPLTRDPSPFIRRFASEATRPRGVWSVHLPLLKREPQHGMPLLEPLSADSSRYVQDSVANWLNDASKTAPEWVRTVCERWLADRHLTPATLRICRRAMRTLEPTRRGFSPAALRSAPSR